MGLYITRKGVRYGGVLANKGMRSRFKGKIYVTRNGVIYSAAEVLRRKYLRKLKISVRGKYNTERSQDLNGARAWCLTGIIEPGSGDGVLMRAAQRTQALRDGAVS